MFKILEFSRAHFFIELAPESDGLAVQPLQVLAHTYTERMKPAPAPVPSTFSSATRLAVVGDSIAYGRSDPSGGWAQYLAAAHISRDELNNRFYNLAIPGKTLAGLHKYTPAEVATRKVDTVIISAGINDLAGVDGSTPVTAKELLEHLKNLSKLLEADVRRVIVLTPLWLDHIAARQQMGFNVVPAQVKKYRNLLVTWADETQHTVIDLYPVLENRPERLVDGVHPDPEGHRLLWESMIAAND
ncbi:hypothetical protein IDM48_10280 [Rothia amarae]|uniref:SGNH hydrolase-type esterase domain-containing protein n=1 Tax=Rothia amarae TaxID=169480 RepID=A0A7H2BJ79_9MICC|nr:SGNH/GDSL hydrolase family protein [Rothia amarae]QNV39725.1 hypothetical protein IDM48_10280 [Rothia amarae]